MVILTPFIVDSSSDLNDLRIRLKDLYNIQEDFNSNILEAIRNNEREGLYEDRDREQKEAQKSQKEDF